MRNLLDGSREPWENAGYRDVTVWLRLVTPVTRWLGVSGFVCEVQLAHRDLVALLNPQQHERYIRYTSACLWPRLSLALPLQTLCRALIFETPHKLSAYVSRFLKSRSFRRDNASSLAAQARRRIKRERDEHDLREQPPLDSVEHMRSMYVLASQTCSDQDIDTNTKELILRRTLNIMRVRNNLEGGFLEDCLNQGRNGVQSADTTMVLFTRPMGAFGKKPILFIVLGAGIYFAYDLLWVPTGRLVRAVGETSVKAHHLRLTVLETRSPQYSPAAPGAAGGAGGASAADVVSISEFGPLIDGCRVDQKLGYSAREMRDSSRVLLTLTNKSADMSGPPDAVEFESNGFFIKTNAEPGSQARDPLRFVIHRTNHQALDATQVAEKDWLLFAASDCYYGLNEPQCLPMQTDKADLPLERSATHYVDLSVTWYMLLGTVLSYIPIVVGCIMCAILGFAGFSEKSLSWFAVNFWMPGLAELLTAAGMVLDNIHSPARQLTSFYWWVLGLSSLTFGWIVQFHDLSFMRYCVVHFLVTIIGLNVHNYVNKQKDYVFEVPFSPAITLMFWVVLSISRVVVLRRSVNRMKVDYERYHAEWKALTDDASNVQVLLQIEAVAKGFESRSRPQQRLFLNFSASSTLTTGVGFLPQNLFQLASRPSWACRLRNSLNATASTQVNPPIGSLDQLYLHAALLEPLFVKKVRDMALASSGLVLLHKLLHAKPAASASSATLAADGHISVNTDRPYDSSSRYISWDHALFEQQLKNGGVLCLKSVDRMIEKLTRSYNYDVSVLLDIVRQCIVFETPHHMLLAVKHMQQDPDIHVIRVKNRLSSSYDDASSLGYRDILVNCCIVSQTVRDMGMSEHVCEIQLILRSFMDTKTQQGHERYVRFRNMRCE